MKKNGFTLIELMIVIAIIGILMGTTFKLMRVANEAKAKAVTRSRLERLQNALSGYYAAYGMYPAVPMYGNPSQSQKDQDDEDTKEAYEKAKALARAQPIGFEFPPPLWLTTEWLIDNKGENVISMATAVGDMDANDESWEKCRTFKFGLLSFLLPRVQVVGLSFADAGNPQTDKKGNYPIYTVYEMAQWKSNNKSSSFEIKNSEDYGELARRLQKQRDAENEACRRWMPCFENSLRSFRKDILGVNVSDGSTLKDCVFARAMPGNDQLRVGLASITIVDGWGNEFYYFSPAPHQSFRLWSAGEDEKTFPPWVSISDSDYTKDAQEWIKDDIIGGKMQ